MIAIPTMGLQAKDVEDDSKVKTWLTAELLGAMRWAKAESETTKEKLDFTAAELVCHKRLKKQIDAGKIKKGTAFIIAENVRKKGIYRDEKLTLTKAEDLRKKIVSASIFEAVAD
jgi:hypothetical protein